MTNTPPVPPQNILFATDLGPRSDRAHDRVLSLATQWNARLTVAHAVEFDSFYRYAPSWKQGPDRIQLLEQRTAAYFAQKGKQQPDIVIREARPDTLALDVARANGSDLIVVGIARTLPFGLGILGSTVSALVRRAACPVLTVKKRLPHQDYRHIAVGVDMSTFSEQALRYTLAAFPNVQKITAVHAVHTAYRNFADRPDQYAKNLRDHAQARFEVYLASLQLGRAIDFVADEGNPGRLFADYVDDLDVDLVVISTHGESGVKETLLGTNAMDILEAVSCDVLIVR